MLLIGMSVLLMAAILILIVILFAGITYFQAVEWRESHECARASVDAHTRARRRRRNAACCDPRQMP
jgi:hypothetical protein